MTQLGTVTGTLVRSVRPAPRSARPRKGLSSMPEFRREALCGGIALDRQQRDLFFPSAGGTALELQAACRDQAEEAKAVCQRCPVRQACLDWALSVPERAGVWGGKTEDEREELLGKAARRAALDGAVAAGGRA